MINIAICDDEDIILDKYRELFLEIHEENDVTIYCEYFHSAEELLAQKAFVKNLDIVYMDNYMDKLEGIEAAAYIRTVNKEVQIIFYSSSPDFVFDAFRVKASNYLLKGELSDSDFKSNFMSVYKEVITRKKKLFIFQQEKNQMMIPIDEIIAFEIISRKIYVYTLEHTYACYGSINDIYTKFRYDGFVMVNRSCLVNLYYIKKFGSNDITMRNNHKFQITIKRIKEVKKELLHYFNQQL